MVVSFSRKRIGVGAIEDACEKKIHKGPSTVQKKKGGKKYIRSMIGVPSRNVGVQAEIDPEMTLRKLMEMPPPSSTTASMTSRKVNSATIGEPVPREASSIETDSVREQMELLNLQNRSMSAKSVAASEVVVMES